MSGGTIRNAVLRACFRCAADQRRPTDVDFESAARDELASRGRIVAGAFPTRVDARRS